MTQQPAPRVFISYSHDCAEHAACVLKLANDLRRDGVDATIDQYFTSPPEGWPGWMDRHIRDDDFVVMVCTETYYRRVVRKDAPGIGLGVRWEGSLIYNHLYKSDLSRFVPVLLSGGKPDYIPEPVAGATHYPIDTPGGYDFDDPNDAGDAAQLLVERSLMSREEDRHDRLHDLYHDYLRATSDDIPAAHGRFIEAYRSRCADGWASGPNDGYFFQFLPHHLAAAGRRDELQALLADYDWIEAKLKATDVQSVISDYALVANEPDLSLVQRALRLSIPALSAIGRTSPVS